MKTKFTKIIAAATLFITLSVSLSSCIDAPDVWWSNPPYGWDATDSRLRGYWQLVQYNSDPVYPNEANFMYFNGNGYGYYYYFDGGRRMIEDLRYWCQPSVSGASNYQINIQYQFASPLTCSYWFTHNNNTLWLQWTTNGGRVQTYVYDRIYTAPW